jgi:two-component system, NtrC family, sensor kinase
MPSLFFCPYSQTSSLPNADKPEAKLINTIEAEKPQNEVTELRKKIEEMEWEASRKGYQQLSYLGEMMISLTHEVNNPLGAILLYSELLLKSNVPGQTKKDLKVIHGEARRAVQSVNDLLYFYSAAIPELHQTNLHNIIKKVLEIRQYTQNVSNIQSSTRLCSTPPIINGDPAQLRHVIMRVVLNAEECMKQQGGGKLVVSTKLLGDRVKLSIANNGPVVPEEQLQRVTQPFLIMKPAEEKTGMELINCHTIIAAHGGNLTAENNRMGGTTFNIDLPVFKEALNLS